MSSIKVYGQSRKANGRGGCDEMLVQRRGVCGDRCGAIGTRPCAVAETNDRFSGVINYRTERQDAKCLSKSMGGSCCY